MPYRPSKYSHSSDAQRAANAFTQVRIADALELLNANFPASDPQRDRQLQRFHLHAGESGYDDFC